MLTGRRLFKGGNDYETLQKVQTMPVPPPSALNKNVSPELDAIVLQALERDRKQRYGRAAHLARDLDVYLQAHRFSVEDMAEYMSEIFPPDSREEVPEGQMTASYSIPKSEPTMPSSPRAIAGTPSAVRAERAQAEHKAATGRRRIVLYGGAALLALGIAAAVVVPLARRNAPAADKDDRTVVEPIVHPAEADKPLGSDKPIDRPLDAPSEGDVRVISEPAGAEIYAGPKLMGKAPLTLHLGKRGTEPLTLVRPGYEDLNYTVQPGDGPSLTLRMLKKHRATVESRPTPKDKSPHKAKIDTFDDGDKAPHIPKVQTVDD